MGYFLLSQYSQSVLYYSKIHSLPYLLACHGGHLSTLREQIGLSFYELFIRYFDDVNYQVDIKESKGSDTVFIIRLSASVMSESVRYDLAYLVQASQTTVLKFSKINNG